MIVKFPDVGSLGWIEDVPPHDLGEQPLAWSSVNNMSFRAGLAERVQGYAAGFDTTPTQSPLGMFGAVQNDGTAYLVTGGTSKVFCYSGTSENEITGTTTPAATQDTKWSGGELTGFIVLNESTVAPQFIAVSALSTAGAGNVADLTNWPASTTCGVLRPFKYYLVAGDMTESATRYPYKVRWSTAALPGALPASWVASTSNDAGSVDLSGTYGPVIDMVPMGDELVIYRSRGITKMRWIGGTDAVNRLVMAFNDVPSGAVTGILALNCAIDIPGLGHVVLSQNDVYLFDGTSAKSVLDKRHRDWLRKTIDSTYAKRSFVLHHADRSEVWVCIVSQGKTVADQALIFNYSDNTIGLRQIPNLTCGVHVPVSDGMATTWADLTATWEDLTGNWEQWINASQFRKTVIGSTDTKIYVLGNASTANGTAMSSLLEREYLSLGDAQRVKFIRTVWPRLEASVGQTFSIQVGTSMSVDEAITWQGAQTYTVGSSRKVDVNRAGRFMALRISTVGDVWRLRSLDVDVQPQGLW